MLFRIYGQYSSSNDRSLNNGISSISYCLIASNVETAVGHERVNIPDWISGHVINGDG